MHDVFERKIDVYNHFIKFDNRNRNRNYETHLCVGYFKSEVKPLTSQTIIDISHVINCRNQSDGRKDNVAYQSEREKFKMENIRKLCYGINSNKPCETSLVNLAPT